MEKFDMIYIVMGSEDGYLATFTSKKKAIAYGKNYILNGFYEEEKSDIDIDLSEYAHGIYLDGPDRVSVEIFKDEISR
jgi:hypothetical protein